MRRQITTSEIIQAYGERLKASQYHSMPGIVRAYYPGAPATVDVQPAVNDVRFDPDTGERVSEPWPIIPKVPICYPSGGGYSITFPLSVGDKVELISDDLDPTVYRQTGNQSDPQDVRRHGGAYWKALPCDTTDASAPAGGSTLVIGKGSTKITIDGTNIILGGTSDFVALASKVDACMALIKSHVHTAPSGGGPTTTSPTLAALPATGSTLVKAS